MTTAPPRAERAADATAPVPTPRRDWRLVAAAMFASGWGANQFTPLLVVYRSRSHYSDLAVDAMFGAYVLGLIPGLLLGGPAADRLGRRRVVLPVTVLAAAASAVLALGAAVPAGLYLGRLISGIAAGAALAAATAWVKELSCPPHDTAGAAAGARRAALSTTSGFGAGALVAGLLAQYAPWPTVLPYAAHLVLAVPVAVALRRATETAHDPQPRTTPRALLRAARVPEAGNTRFVAVVAPMAPWVFGSAAVAYAILPGQVADGVAGWPVAFTALITALTLAVGVAVQPLARRLHRPGSATTIVVAMAVVAAGLVPAVFAARLHSPALLVPTAALLGAGYGIGLVAGLLEVQAIAAPARLAGLSGVYYVLTYLGFFLPVVLAGLTAATGVGYPAVFAVLAVLAAATAAWTALAARRPAAAPADGSTTSDPPGAVGGGR